MMQKIRSFFVAAIALAALLVTGSAWAVEVPSFIQTDAKLWLDASDAANFEFDANDKVTKWKDKSNNQNDATPASTSPNNVTNYGTREQVNGRWAFQMGNVGSGIDLGFTQITSIRTVFWVMDIAQSSSAFFLGNTGGYDFHRGNNGAYAAQPKPFNQAKLISCDGVAKQSSDIVPTGLHLYATILNSNASANRLSQDRTQNGRNGGRALSELIIFERVLNEEEMEAVSTYLRTKWLVVPTPIAVWDGDLADNSTKNNVKIVLNGNTAEDGVVTITQATGIQVQNSNFNSRTFTVLVKYSELITAPGTANRSLITAGGGNNSFSQNIDNFGVYAMNGSTAKGVVGGAAWPSDAATYSKGSFKNEGVMALAYNYNNTTKAYMDGQLVYDASTKLQGSGVYIHCIGVGGNYSTTGSGKLVAATGMKIEGVAIFRSLLSQEEIAAYKFPTHWTGGEGNWSDEENWSNGVPAANQIAIIPAGAVVNVDSAAVTTGVTIQGSGMVIYDNRVPGNEKTSYQAADWTGTVWLKNITSWTAWFNVNLYGNLSSKVAITGFDGYFAVPGAGGGQIAKHIPEVVLIDDGNTAAITIGNGSSGDGNEVNFSKFSGSGTLTSVTSGVGQKYVVNDASEFTGSITMVGDKGLTIGDEKAAGNNQILIAANKVARIGSENTWTANGGIIINGTLCGAGTLASATTFGENSSVVASLDGALTISGAITGTVKIDGSAIDDAETKPDYVKVLTATAETKPTCELFGVEGYELFWKGDDLYAGDSAKRALYKQFSYANAIYTWRGTGAITDNTALYYILDPDFGEDQGTVEGSDYFKGGTGYKTIPGCAGDVNRTFWCTFAYSSSVTGYNAPGNVLRFVQSDTYGKSISATFGPLSFGGLIVEKGATGYKLETTENKTRSNSFGDPTGSATTYYVINEDFKINRHGKFYLMGDLVFEVAEGKTFDLNYDQNTADYNPIIYKMVAIAQNGNFGATTPGGSLTMKGAGKLKVRNLTASGATLDYSNQDINRTDPFITGNLTVDKDTTFKFPAGFNPIGSADYASFKLCEGAITGPAKIVGANIYVGGEKLSGKELVFDLQNGTVSYQDITAPKIDVEKDISITDIEGKVTSGYTELVVLNFKSDGLALVIDKAIPFSSIILECTGLVTLAAGATDGAYVPVADDFNKINWNDVSVTNKRIYRNIAPFGAAPAAGMTYRYEGTKTLDAIPFVGDSVAGTIEVDCPIADNGDALLLAGNKNIVFGPNFSATIAGCVSFGGSAGITQTITQNGGTITANRTGDGSGSCGESAFIPARFSVPVTYNLLGGMFSAPNGSVQYWDGTPTINIGGGSGNALFSAKGIRYGTGNKNQTSVVNVKSNGTLEIGANGVTQNTNHKIVLDGGIYKATATHTISGGALQFAANSTFNVVENDAILTMAPATITGTGSITKIGAGTLKFDNAHHFYGAQHNYAPQLIITGGTLNLNNAYTYANDGSGFLTQKPITLGSATTIMGGNVTFYGNNSNNIVYDGGNGENAPAEFAANWYGSYSNDPRTRNINVGKGAGEEYDLLISGTFGLSGAQFNGTTIHKTGVGTAMMTGAFNIPTLSIDAGTWKMGAANAVPATTTVGEDGTLDVNGQTATVATLTSTGTISSSTPATINVTSSATISGRISGVTLVSQGGTITVQGGTTIGDNVKFVVDLDESFIGATPFTFADETLYASVETKGDSSVLKYNTKTHTIVYGGKNLSDTMIWLPIGDSITEGERYMGHPDQTTDVGERGGYRYQLYSQLVADVGQNVRSVGYRTGHMGTVELDDCPWAWHAALYGGAIAYDNNNGSQGTHGAALFNVENTLQVAGYPDVITILLGVNDLSFSNATKEGVYDSMDAMVKKIAKMRPNSKILVSTLLPAGGNRGYIDTYNALLREKNTANASPFNLPNVKLVDVNKKFGPYNAGYFKSDNLHPNEPGSIRVAKCFVGFMATAINEIANDSTKMVHVHNGVDGKIIVRFSKALDNDATATLTIAGKNVDGEDVRLDFTNGAVDTTDKRVMRFEIPQGTTLKGGVYTATLSAIDTEPLSSDFVEIQGTGAEANIDKAYRKDFQRYGTVKFSDGTPIPEDGIGLGDNWGETGPTIDDVNEELEGVEINRVGYYIELKRENEPSQFVWVSMDAFSTSLPDLLVPIAEVGAHKAKVANLQVYANRANVTNTAIDDNGVVDTTQTGVVEFTPWSWSGADQNGYINDIYSGKTGWNDTLETADGTLKGGMQVFHYTGETTDKYTKFAAETVFAVNNFNCDTAMDLGIGSFSTHHSNAGERSAIACTWDWSNFVSQSKYKKFAVNAYEVKKMEIWVVPMSEIVWTGDGDDNNWNTKENWDTGTVPASYSNVIIPEGATIVLNDDVTIARLNEDASASITGKGSIKITDLAASTLKGTATIVFDGALPDTATKDQLKASTWTGTAWIKNYEWQKWAFEDYGNANSFIKLTGITGYGPDSDDKVVQPEVILADEGDIKALTMSNGYSVNVYTFRKISGTGTITTTKDSVTQTFIFKDVSTFEGKITSIKGFRIVVGNAESVGSTYTSGAITFADGVSVKAGLGWEAASVVFGKTIVINNVSGEDDIGKVLVTSVTAAPATFAGVLDAYGNAAKNLALGYDSTANTIKIVEAKAQIVDEHGNVKSYDSIEDAIKNEGTGGAAPTITPTEATTLDLNKLNSNNKFKLDAEAIGTYKIGWDDIAPVEGGESGKYLACNGEGTLTVTEGKPQGSFTSFECYALGIDAETESLPKTDVPADNGYENTMTVEVKSMPRNIAGKKIVYQAFIGDTQHGQDVEFDGKNAPTIQLGLPGKVSGVPESGEVIYTIKVKVEDANP